MRRSLIVLGAIFCLLASPMLALELSPGIKQLESSLQVRLQDQVNSLFGEGARIVVNVHVKEGRPVRPAPRRARTGPQADEMELGYLPVPVPQEAEQELTKPEAKLSIESVEVDLWIHEDTPDTTVESVKSLVKQTLSAYRPGIRVNKTSVSFADGILKKLSVWKPYLPVIGALGAALILAFGLTFMGLTIRRSANVIAERMPSVGGEAGGAETNVNIKNEGLGAAEVPRLAPPSSSSSPAPPMATLRIQMLKVRTEILENMNQATEATILHHLNTLVAADATVERAVVLLELLGKDAAANFFKRLPIHTRQVVVQFMRQGVLSRPKMELMLETAEELKTKLLVDSFDSLKAGASEEVAERIIHLSDQQLAEAFVKLPTDALARLYLYMEPAKISASLALLKKIDRTKFEQAVDMLPRMPEVAKMDSLDATIMKVLEEYVTKVQSDVQAPFLRTYQKIIEAAGEEVGGDILLKLSANARLDTYLSENLITAKTIFRLAPEARKEMVAALSNKVVAALCVGLSKEERLMLVNAAGERRRALIAEELDTLIHRGGKQTAAAASAAKNAVVQKMQIMKNEGTLSINLKDQTVSNAASSEQEVEEPSIQQKKKGAR